VRRGSVRRRPGGHREARPTPQCGQTLQETAAVRPIRLRVVRRRHRCSPHVRTRTFSSRGPQSPTPLPDVSHAEAGEETERCGDRQVATRVQESFVPVGRVREQLTTTVGPPRARKIAGGPGRRLRAPAALPVVRSWTTRVPDHPSSWPIFSPIVAVPFQGKAPARRRLQDDKLPCKFC
jgi:hypothetical protein